MSKKSQALIITIWVLVILTILAISIGHRVSMALRLVRYQRDKLKATYLAKAGINRAISELEKDAKDTAYDSLNEAWSTGIDYNKGALDEKFLVHIIDEERKININTVSSEFIISLLEKCAVPDAYKIADNICAWRGDQGLLITEEAKDYRDLGYTCKAGKLNNAEELILIKGITSNVCNSFKELITVYPLEGNGKVNINTASREVLEILVSTCFKKLQARQIPGITENDAQALLTRIIEAQKAGVFENIDLPSSLGLSPDQAGQLVIATDSLDGLQNQISVRSEHFKIESQGKVGNITKNITAIYDRGTKKIIYWHEN